MNNPHYLQVLLPRDSGALWRGCGSRGFFVNLRLKMASRTRERLIDVARQLFLHQGIDKTTMNDIATASDRGRRTIYTYFRTKNDIFEAVVSNEAGKILADLESAINSATDATSKIRELVNFRINIARRNAADYQVWYKSLFSSNIKRAQAVREMVTKRLYELIDEILDEGVKSGEFDAGQARLASSTLTMIIRGSDWTIMRQVEQEMYDKWHRESVDFIVNGLRARNPKNN